MTDNAEDTWRTKRLVLCFYEYVGRDVNRTTRLTDSVMIKVEFTDQIIDEFERVMRQYKQKWAYGISPGPFPLEWKLLRYLPEHGQRKLQCRENGKK